MIQNWTGSGSIVLWRDNENTGPWRRSLTEGISDAMYLNILSRERGNITAVDDLVPGVDS